MTTGAMAPEARVRPRFSILLLKGLAAAVATGLVRLFYCRFVFDMYNLRFPVQLTANVLQNGLAFLHVHTIFFDWVMDDNISGFVGRGRGKPLHHTVYRGIVLRALPWLVVPWAWSRWSL